VRFAALYAFMRRDAASYFVKRLYEKMFPVAFGTFLTLAVASAGGALAMLLADNEWAKHHAWLMPALWIATGVFTLLAVASSQWWRRLFVSNDPGLPVTSQITRGALSPNISASAGSTVSIAIAGPADQSQVDSRRPFVRPVAYSHVDYVQEIFSGYREFLAVSNDGESAYDLKVETLRVGGWVVEFEPFPLLKGVGRILESRISKTKMIGGQQDLAITQKLDSAWLDAQKEQTFEKLVIQIRYVDFRHRPFVSTCSIERRHSPRGLIVFVLSDFSDVLELPMAKQNGKN
jgi:hypothetical protein